MSEHVSQAYNGDRALGRASAEYCGSTFWQQYAAGEISLDWRFGMRDAAVQLFGSAYDQALAYFQDHPALEKAVVTRLADAMVARQLAAQTPAPEPSPEPAPEVDPRQHTAAQLLASGSTRKAAAEAIGLSYSYFYKWAKDQDFIDLVETYKAEAT